MCGRFAFYSPHEAVVRLFGVADAPEIEPRYNIAPTQFVAAVREAGGPARGGDAVLGPRAVLGEGEVHRRADDQRAGGDARREAVVPHAFQRRRCLVLADGYYEWQRSGSIKQPYFISFADGEPFGMAGLWERWRDAGSGELLESCCIVTTSPAPAVAHVHDRMPVIVPPDAYDEWLTRAMPRRSPGPPAGTLHGSRAAGPAGQPQRQRRAQPGGWVDRTGWHCRRRAVESRPHASHRCQPDEPFPLHAGALGGGCSAGPRSRGMRPWAGVPASRFRRRLLRRGTGDPRQGAVRCDSSERWRAISNGTGSPSSSATRRSCGTWRIASRAGAGRDEWLGASRRDRAVLAGDLRAGGSRVHGPRVHLHRCTGRRTAREPRARGRGGVGASSSGASRSSARPAGEDRCGAPWSDSPGR